MRCETVIQIELIDTVQSNPSNNLQRVTNSSLYTQCDTAFRLELIDTVQSNIPNCSPRAQRSGGCLFLPLNPSHAGLNNTAKGDFLPGRQMAGKETPKLQHNFEYSQRLTPPHNYIPSHLLTPSGD
jgi:hypothetical protein